jgi:hypothetical protein
LGLVGPDNPADASRVRLGASASGNTRPVLSIRPSSSRMVLGPLPVVAPLCYSSKFFHNKARKHTKIGFDAVGALMPDRP